MKHQVFYGGDLRPVGHAHSRAAGWKNPVVRYAAHLPVKHKVLPFEYDGGLEEWQEYANLHGEFATGDTIDTHALSVDSRIDAVVFHNKKRAGAFDEKSGAVTKAAKIKIGLYNGETLVDESDEIDLSVIGRTVLEFGKPTAPKTATKKDTNDDGKLSKEDKATHAVSSLGVYLGENGTIRITVVEGAGLNGACFSAFCELVDFLDVRPCSCAAPACESEYPEPECY